MTLEPKLIKILNKTYRKKYGSNPSEDLFAEFQTKMLTTEIPERINDDDYYVRWVMNCFNNFVIDDYRKQNSLKNKPKGMVDIEHSEAERVEYEELLGSIHHDEPISVFEDYIYFNLEDSWQDIYNALSNDDKALFRYTFLSGLKADDLVEIYKINKFLVKKMVREFKARIRNLI